MLGWECLEGQPGHTATSDVSQQWQNLFLAIHVQFSHLTDNCNLCIWLELQQCAVSNHDIQQCTWNIATSERIQQVKTVHDSYKCRICKGLCQKPTTSTSCRVSKTLVASYMHVAAEFYDSLIISTKRSLHEVAIGVALVIGLYQDLAVACHRGCRQP